MTVSAVPSRSLADPAGENHRDRLDPCNPAHHARALPVCPTLGHSVFPDKCPVQWTHPGFVIDGPRGQTILSLTERQPAPNRHRKRKTCFLMSYVELKSVRKRFGDTEIIHGIDLGIAKEEFTVFVGPSGCGKSTLLRMIAGLEDLQEGSIHIGGARVDQLQPAERGIAMVFQNYALYPHMTVFENMAFGLKIAKTGAAEIRTKVERAASILQISEILQRRPRELSGGQRQRVAIGRASCASRRSSSSTSRCPTSMPSCASRCASSSRACAGSSAPP